MLYEERRKKPGSGQRQCKVNIKKKAHPWTFIVDGDSFSGSTAVCSNAAKTTFSTPTGEYQKAHPWMDFFGAQTPA